jgi:hypothetical protein
MAVWSAPLQRDRVLSWLITEVAAKEGFAAIFSLQIIAGDNLPDFGFGQSERVSWIMQITNFQP